MTPRDAKTLELAEAWTIAMWLSEDNQKAARAALIAHLEAVPDEREAFEAWAKARGMDVAYTYDTERSRHVWLNPMTADLWDAWQARSALGAPAVQEDSEAVKKDALRWRGVKARHGMSLVRLATSSGAYNSAKKDAILDAWADLAASEVDAFDKDAWHEEVLDLIAAAPKDAKP